MKSKLFLFALVIYACVACNSNPTISTSAAAKDSSGTETKEARNKRVALESLAALEAGNADGVLKDAVPDAVDYGDGSSAPLKGTDSLKVNMKAWFDCVKYDKSTDLMALADGDNVVIYQKWHAKFIKDFMGMKTSGKSFSVADVDMFKFNNEGKIIEHRSVQPMSSIMSQVLPKSK